MKKLTYTWTLPVVLAALVSIGCSQETSRKDVASARDKLQKEQQQTTETARQGQRDIADAQQKAQEHTVAKPVTTDQPTKEQQKVADAQLTAAEKVAKQKEKEREAAGNLADKEKDRKSVV